MNRLKRDRLYFMCIIKSARHDVSTAVLSEHAFDQVTAHRGRTPVEFMSVGGWSRGNMLVLLSFLEIVIFSKKIKVFFI